MLKFLPLLLALTACADQSQSCAAVAPQVHLSPGCPSIPATSGLTISGRIGTDFWSCQALDSHGQVALSIYLGNHPDSPKNLRYAGVTAHPRANLVWFTSSEGSDGRWYTFIPTGDRVSSVMAVSFTLPQHADLRHTASLVAQLELRRIEP